MEAIGNDDVVKPDVLVEEFLAQSSLKVLPKNEFIQTLESFVEKGGAHVMDEFVSESLSKSLSAIVKISASDPDADISTLLEAWKEREDQSFVKRGKDASGPKRRMKERPEDYDSDLGAHWGDNPDHWDETPVGAPTKKTTRGRNRRSASNDDVDMDDMFVSQGNQDDSIASRASKPAAKRGAAARKAPAKKPAKKAPANGKAPATRGRPKQKSGIIVDSDEDEEEEAEEADAMSEDVFMDEDEEDGPPAPPPPTRAARTTKAATSRTATSRATKVAPATKTRQATLNFSQSQRPAAQRVTQTQKALEISDDEIDDDDDDDDGFEPVAPSTTRSRRR